MQPPPLLFTTRLGKLPKAVATEQTEAGMQPELGPRAASSWTDEAMARTESHELPQSLRLLYRTYKLASDARGWPTRA